MRTRKPANTQTRRGVIKAVLSYFLIIHSQNLIITWASWSWDAYEICYSNLPGYKMFYINKPVMYVLYYVYGNEMN